MTMTEAGQKNKCLRCGHEWIQRKEGIPDSCPGCKSYKWDTPPPEEEKSGQQAG